ncbi:MAG TPA: DUF4167 domain-containing protein [Paenirhodobacter sp.]
MRSSKSRSRNKSNRQRTIGNIINRVFDSSGPESKVRGTPQQIIEKYLGLARDAQLGNDRVAEQNFLQHAEHYTRMLGEAQREMAREMEERQRNFPQNGNVQNGGQGGGQSGGQNGNRDRQERPDSEAEPRYEAADTVDVLTTSEDSAGLVETPEMRGEPQPVIEPVPVVVARAPAPVPAAPVPAVVEPAGAAPLTEVGAEAVSAEVDAEAPRPARARPRRSPRKPRAPKAAEGETAQLPLDTQSNAASE